MLNREDIVKKGEELIPTYEYTKDSQVHQEARFDVSSSFDEDFFRMNILYEGEITQKSLDNLFRITSSLRLEGYVFWGFNQDKYAHRVVVTYRKDF